MTKLNVAIVGLGMAVTPHAKSYVQLADRVAVRYAYSPSVARRQAFAAKFPFPHADSLETILADKAVDAVAVLTPPNTHLELVERCAAAGKHVLLEKPLETTFERSRAVVEACRRAGVKLGVTLQHRFRPAGMKLKSMLDADALGRIAAASTSMRLWRPQSYYDEPGRGTKARDGGGVLLTQGIHTLDLMLSLVGAAKEVVAYATTTPVHRMETEDLVAGAVQFANGAFGTIDATTASYPGFPERIELICEKGTAVLAGTALDVFWHDGRRDHVAPDSSPGGTGADPMAFPNDWHRALIADFLDAVANGREPRASGAEALKVHALIDALLRASSERKPVAVAATP
jgi:UDP-N-acetyl-2-amino-2-deoxyglucuronate dehydrogenase